MERRWQLLPHLRSLASRLCFGLLACAVTAPSFAMTPLRDPQQLWEPTPDQVLHVKTARVLLADYELIRRDFPEIAGLTDLQIDAWILRNAAFISPEQAAQEVVNTKIETEGPLRRAFRPREYRRAHVFVTDTGGLIDAKGTGSVDPHQGNERNGLATLADALREYLYEKLVSRIFRFVGRFDTVGTYGVIDLGFDVIFPDGRRTRAGIVLRQAHVRFHKGSIGKREREDPVVLPTDQQLEVELTLRRFGLSASIEVHPGLYSVSQWGDQLNLQGAEDGAIVDYGGFRARAHFDRPIYSSYTREGHANVSDADIVLKPHDARFVQPDARLAVPLWLWGNTATGGGLDNAYEWSEHLAQALREGRADRQAAETHFRNFIAPIDALLAAARHGSPAILSCAAVFAP